MTDQINISDFIDNEYRDYSIHTITHRAIPLFIDGLKPVQRKTLFTALKECPKKEIKVSTLSGALPKIGAYHHGSASGDDAIVKMAQDFKNNVPLLEGIGSFGSRPVPVAAASRYIHTKLNENFNRYFSDNEVLPQSLDKDDHPEPICYLPLIPFSLVNGADGVAVGAATKIISRNPKDIAKSCKEYLENGTIRSQLRPYVRSFRGKFKQMEPGKYKVSGSFDRIGKTKIRINELPLGFTHEQYLSHLNKLRMEKESVITGRIMDDTSDGFEFTITLSKIGKSLTDEQLIKKFKLETIITENITLVVFDDMTTIPDDNTNYALKVYDSARDVVSEFVDFRIKFVDERIKFHTKRCQDEIADLEKRILFVESVVDGTFVIKNRTRKQMVDELTKTYGADYAEKFVQMSIYSFSKDNIKKMKDRLVEVKKELKHWKSCDAKTLYIEDLDALIAEI